MPTNPWEWSGTASDNDDADSAINFLEGQAPGSLNGSARALMAALARYLADNNGSKTTAGAANTYTLASPNVGYTALTNGLTLAVKFNATNTGASTFNLAALGSRKIKSFSTGVEAELAAGQIVANGHYSLQLDTALDSGSGAWVLLNPTSDPTINATTGDIKIWPDNTAPTGWLFCGGQAVSRATYANLFALLGTGYGAGDGSTTFNVPDLRGRSVFGRDDMGGAGTAGRITLAGSGITGTTLNFAGGSETVTLTTAQIPSHTHAGTTASNGAHFHSASTTSDGAHTHTYSGTTGNQSVDHTHSGTTATESVGHTHTYSGTTGDDSPDHTHSTTVGANSSDNFAGNSGGATGPFPLSTDTAYTSGGASVRHQHSYSGTSSDVSATHTHTVTTGGVSANHTHTYSGTTSSDGAHTHTLITTTDGAHTHTFTSDATGGGTAHNNMPPAIILNFVIRT